MPLYENKDLDDKDLFRSVVLYGRNVASYKFALAESLLELGKDNKKSVVDLLGTPSFEGTLGDNSYYYIGTLSSKLAFLKQKTKKPHFN